jgi:hypothetical protein
MAPAPKAYCVKCKAKRDIKDPVMEVMKNKRKRVHGKCATCGGKIGVFVKDDFKLNKQ